ncbi:PTS transporter subunit EIIC [Spiroplasma endosymbiont of Amphibalanus improvisus]|uniref:PTS transporter subunit EIIC n=1 Tax=Spiroplasma endosymbiont of Amphibalanus improvisus TaxID=3066327 RepID=UPI00313DA6BD
MIVLPVAVLPVAGLLLGLGGGISAAIESSHPGSWVADIFTIMKEMGNVVFANLGLLFCIGISFGFAKKSKGVAALSGFLAFIVMTASIHGLFLPSTQPDGTIALGFDPWKLSNFSGKPGVIDADDMNSGYFSNLLGLSPTIDTSVFGGIIIGWLVGVVHNRSYNIRLPRVFAFFGGERFVPILAIFLGIGTGITFFFVWPILLIGFMAMGTGLGNMMNTGDSTIVNGQLVDNFSPTAAGAFACFMLGFVERLLIPTGLHHVLYTPFWFTDVGGTWTDPNGEIFHGAYNIFFGQYGSGLTGHLTQEPGTVFMSGRFSFMEYGLPFAALAMWQLAKPERKKAVGGIMLSAALTSFLTGITEPMLFSFVFVAPWLFIFHATMAGLSFMSAYLLNIVVGQGFSAGFIDFTAFGIVPAALHMQNGFYWIFVQGLFMAPAYYFGFYWIIKLCDYKTPGREDGEMGTNIALGAMEASLDKKSKNAKTKEQLLFDGLGGKANILDITYETTFINVKVKKPKSISDAMIRLSGTKSIKVDGSDVKINYLEVDIAKKLYDDTVEYMKKNPDDKNAKLSERAEKIFKALGGRDNIVVLDNCATRLRVTLKSIDLVDKDLLKETGALGNFIKGNNIQVIYGPEVVNIRTDMDNIK